MITCLLGKVLCFLAHNSIPFKNQSSGYFYKHRMVSYREYIISTDSESWYYIYELYKTICICPYTPICTAITNLLRRSVSFIISSFPRNTLINQHKLPPTYSPREVFQIHIQFTKYCPVCEKCYWDTLHTKSTHRFWNQTDLGPNFCSPLSLSRILNEFFSHQMWFP